MMLCEHCHKNEATFHRVQVINGMRRETHLCAQCLASEQGQGNMGALWASILSPAEFLERTKQPACSRCGMTPARFQQTGRLGCGECYSDLMDMLEPLIKRVQGRSRHIGRSPGNMKVQSAQAPDPLIALRGAIGEAVAKEDYEKAAQLRDEIKKLERQRELDNTSKEVDPK